jgi:hypothetical protein
MAIVVWRFLDSKKKHFLGQWKLNSSTEIVGEIFRFGANYRPTASGHCSSMSPNFAE